MTPGGICAWKRGPGAAKQGPMDYEALVELAYEGAIEADPWSSFLHELRTGLSSKSAMLMFALPGERGAPRDLDDADWQVSALTSLYYSTYAPLNPIGYAAMTAGRAYSLYDFVDREALVASPYYTEFLRRIGLHYALVVRLPADDGVSAWLNISRGEDAGDYDAEERRGLEALAPHLHRALRIHARLQTAEVRLSAYSRPSETIKVAALLLDAAGRVSEMNEHARQLLARTSALALANQRLAFADPVDRRAYDEAFGRVMQPDSDPDYAVLAVGARFGAGLNLLLRRFNANQRGAAPFAGVLYVKDPREQAYAQADAVSVLFGLKPMEARLAVAIANGSSVREAAAALGVTEMTVRTYMKRVLEKVGASRQADLVKLITSSLAVMV
jgi:DNA-binding CsgD family transcriptional regulator